MAFQTVIYGEGPLWQPKRGLEINWNKSGRRFEKLLAS